MKAKLLLVIFFLSFSFSIFGQDDQWEPHKQLTGYLCAQAEYIDGLKIFERNYGVSLNEAGILFTYQPLKNLSLKTTFVYRPGLLFDQMLNDLYAEWKYNNHLKMTAGRFLTPLSPLNLTQYAPMNIASSLPMLITHHNMYPMHMDGISFSGSEGENIKFNYNVFGGGYFDAGYLAFDPVGYAGKEIFYTEAMEVGGTFDSDVKNADMALFGAVGTHLGLDFNEIFNVGFNIFYGGTDKYFNPYDSASVAEAENTNIGKGTKHAFGLDAKFKISNIELSGEYWIGKLSAINEPSQDISGGFFEFSGTFGKISPFIQFERHLMYDLHYSRYVAGVNIKPTFETTVKFEYSHFVFDGNDELDKYNMDNLSLSLIYSFF
jgi:hypothetical protein